MPNSEYEVYALRYAARPDCTSDDVFHLNWLYGEPTKPYPMDYFFWLIRNDDRTVLVDCGYSAERALERNRPMDTEPATLLSRMGVRPADVDHVVLSHMHYDHVGNVGLFPNATFSIAGAELDYWTGPYADRPTIAWATAPDEIRAVADLAREERLTLVDETAELFPGIGLTRLPGHTPGQLITEITTGSGQVVLASDSIHYDDEMLLDRPFHLFSDLAGMYRGYEALRALSAREGTVVIAGHDPSVMSAFQVVEDECVDLTTSRRNT